MDTRKAMTFEKSVQCPSALVWKQLWAGPLYLASRSRPGEVSSVVSHRHLLWVTSPLPVHSQARQASQ